MAVDLFSDAVTVIAGAAISLVSATAGASWSVARFTAKIEERLASVDKVASEADADLKKLRFTAKIEERLASVEKVAGEADADLKKLQDEHMIAAKGIRDEGNTAIRALREDAERMEIITSEVKLNVALLQQSHLHLQQSHEEEKKRVQAEFARLVADFRREMVDGFASIHKLFSLKDDRE